MSEQGGSTMVTVDPLLLLFLLKAVLGLELFCSGGSNSRVYVQIVPGIGGGKME